MLNEQLLSCNTDFFLSLIGISSLRTDLLGIHLFVPYTYLMLNTLLIRICYMNDL